MYWTLTMLGRQVWHHACAALFTAAGDLPRVWLGVLCLFGDGSAAADSRRAVVVMGIGAFIVFTVVLVKVGVYGDWFWGPIFVKLALWNGGPGPALLGRATITLMAAQAW